MNLYCELSDISASVFFWFLCGAAGDECTSYAQATPVINGVGAVSVSNPIAGVEVTLDQAALTGEMALSVVSIMSFDLSVYDRAEVRTFRCGRTNNPESNAITIDFTIISMS